MCRKATHGLILLLLVLTPIININELLWAIGIESVRGGVFLIKLIKDIGFLLIILFSIFGIVYTKQVPKSYLALPFCFTLISICILLSTGNSGTIHILSGLRWCLPMFLFVFLYNNIDRQFMEKVSYIVFVLLLLNTIAQIIELFYMPPYNGQTYFGLSGRTPGMFSHAHSCASFICLSYVIVNEFAKHKTIKIFGRIFAILGVVLAMSSSGVICLLTIMYLQIIKQRRNYIIFIILVPAIVLLTYEFADVLTNRMEGSSALSINTRKDFFIDGLYLSHIISTTFGYATNSAVMLSEQYFFADAFYASFLVNLGILPFILMVFFIIYIGLIAIIRKQNLLLNVIIIYSLFAFSILITEVFPMNFFLAIFMAYLTNRNVGNTLLINIKHRF
jgi:hypothetical protein